MTTEDPEKCPCCDNPWARATGDLFAKLCVECEPSDKKTTTSDKKEPSFGLSRANMDLTVKPQDNFFEYANGSWMKSNPIPTGYPSWNTFLALHVQSQERCKALLLELTNKEVPTDEERKVADFYAAAMDEEAIESKGIEPMEPLLQQIDVIVATYKDKNLTEYALQLGKLAATYGIYAFLGTGAGPDYKDSDHSLCSVGQGGLGVSSFVRSLCDRLSSLFLVSTQHETHILLTNSLSFPNISLTHSQPRTTASRSRLLL